MTSRAVCYVTDIGFLFPSIVSIESTARDCAASGAQVYLFLIDVAEDVQAVAAKRLATHNVRIVPMDSRLFGQFDAADFNKTHVPIATLGRFFVDPMLPDHVSEVIYIDGDTLAAGAIAPLLEAAVPEGRFLAAEDISSFCRKDVTPYGGEIRAYFAGIGLGNELGYFNAGVFKTMRRTWRSIGAEAFAFFIANIKACRYHDQSALNATVRDRRLVLSTKYNFQTPYLALHVERRVRPVLFHFTQSPKPWMGRSPPWGRFFDRYNALECDRASLNLPLKKLGPAELGQIRKQHVLQMARLYGPFLPRLLRRRARFLELEASAFLR